MRGTGSSPREVWQLAAYVRALRAGAASGRGRVAEVDVDPVTFDRLRDVSEDSSAWLTYSGSYDARRHSPLSQVSSATIERLQIRWRAQLPVPGGNIETTPLVVDGTMFVTAPPQRVFALDARTGERRWSYAYDLPPDLRLCCGGQNRGLAVLGSTLFLGTLDAHLVALDARTGAVLWTVEVADHSEGYSITGAPLAVDGRVIVGIGGGEFGVRGFLDAYDAVTGDRVWRFETVPGPGEPGNETWGGDSWKTGGAPTWVTGSYDPDLGLLIWGTGNPAPDYRGDERPGDNLYSNSIVALEVETGRLRWYFQATPHDEHDRDAVEVPVLADLVVDGETRPVVLQANRNGFYYVLDRRSGAFLRGRAFARQTWAEGLDADGRPRVRPESRPSPRGTLVYPGDGGATNWMSPALDPARGLFFVPFLERGGIFVKRDAEARRAGELFVGSNGHDPTDLPSSTGVRALDATTGERRWEFTAPARANGGRYRFNGVLSTAGGLVFGGGDNRFYALDAASGTVLWSRNLGGFIRAAPITYMVDDRQLVTIAAGNSIVTFSLDGR